MFLKSISHSGRDENSGRDESPDRIRHTWGWSRESGLIYIYLQQSTLGFAYTWRTKISKEQEGTQMLSHNFPVGFS